MHFTSHKTKDRREYLVLGLLVARQAPENAEFIASYSPVAINKGRLYGCLVHTRHACTLKGCSHLCRLLSHPLALSYIKDGAVRRCPPAVRSCHQAHGCALMHSAGMLTLPVPLTSC